jgi:protein NrfC
MSKIEEKGLKKSGVSRRDFLKISGTVTAGLGIAGFTNLLWTKDGQAAIEVSGGYLLVDVKKCQGCLTCMMTCAIAHSGEASLSSARLQIIQNSFEQWPGDLTIEQCRQCVEAPCVDICPVDALVPNPDFGNVRMVDKDLCIGCGLCVTACPYIPSRPMIYEDATYDDDKASKCDLCADTPHWNQAGGPSGKQACVEICPLGAIAFTTEVPEQTGDSGYKVNLRDEGWANLGYSTED